LRELPSILACRSRRSANRSPAWKANWTQSRAGRRVFDYALQTLSSEKELLNDVEVLRRGLRPPLNIAVSSFIAEYFIADLLSASVAKHPELVVNTRVMPSREIINAVLSGQAELGFGPFQTHMQAFETIPLMKVRHSLVIGKKNPGYAAIIEGDEMALASSCLIASYLDEPSDRPGQQRIRDFFQTVWQVSSLPLRIELIARGKGLGFLNAPMLADQATTLGLTEVANTAFSSFDRSVGIYSQRLHTLSASAQDFIRNCKDTWPPD